MTNEMMSESDVRHSEDAVVAGIGDAVEHIDKIVRFEGWKVLGYDRCLTWLRDRFTPRLKSSGLKLPTDKAVELVGIVWEEEQALPQSQRTSQRQLAQLVGVPRKTLDDWSRSRFGRNRPNPDLGGSSTPSDDTAGDQPQKQDTPAQAEYQGKPEDIARQLIRQGAFSDEQIKQRSGLPKRKVEQLQKEWKEEQEAESKKLQAAQSETVENVTVDVGWKEDDGFGHTTVYDSAGDEIYVYESWPIVRGCDSASLTTKSDATVNIVERSVKAVQKMSDPDHECYSTHYLYDTGGDPNHPCECGGHQLTEAQRERIVKAATAILNAVQKGK